MSVGSKLDKMENIEENVVTKGAKPADPMPKMSGASVEDLGGPTPENYKPDDDSAKLKTPGGTLKQVKDIVTKGAKPADSMPAGMKEEEEVEGEVVAEDEQTTEDVVSEEETTTDEVVTEEETTEEEVVTEVKIDVEEDINALIAGEELSEEFQEKARTIFETAIKTKVAEVVEGVKSEYEANLVEEVKTIKEELTDRVDSYLEYVADEWFEENALAVEAGLKTEMTESFLSGMKSLFEDHYVSIPDEKYDVVSTMVEKLDDMETKLNEQIEKNVALNKRLSESTSDVILGSVSEGLAATQKEKLATLAEGVEFESEESYKEKLTTLRESYFSDKKVAPQSSADTLMEATDGQPVEQVSGSMESYMDVLGKMKN